MFRGLPIIHHSPFFVGGVIALNLSGLKFGGVFSGFKRRLSSISPVRDVIVYPLPEDSHVLRDYWVCEPYARVVVAEDVSGEVKYYVLEEPLTFLERGILDRVVSFIVR